MYNYMYENLSKVLGYIILVIIVIDISPTLKASHKRKFKCGLIEEFTTSKKGKKESYYSTINN